MRAMLLALALLAGCRRAPDPEPACPPDMAQVQGAGGPFCMHRYEVRVEGGLWGRGPGQPPAPDAVRPVSQAGLIPTTGITWYQARDICASAGYHLCTSAEWEDACDAQAGPGGRDYPTESGRYTFGECGINGRERGVNYPLAPTGSYPNCRTPTGIYDMMGNIWEWTDPGLRDGANAVMTDKRGGAHYTENLVPCDLRDVGAHAPTFEGSIGFRCCTAPN